MDSISLCSNASSNVSNGSSMSLVFSQSLSSMSVEAIIELFKNESEVHAKVVSALEIFNKYDKPWLRPKELVENKLLRCEGKRSRCQNRLYKCIDMGLADVAQSLMAEKRNLSEEVSRLKMDLEQFDELGMLGNETFQEQLVEFEENVKTVKRAALICLRCFNFSTLRRNHGSEILPVILQAIGDGLQKCIDSTSKSLIYHLHDDQFGVLARFDNQLQLQELVKALVDAGSILVDIKTKKTSVGIICGAVMGKNSSWSDAEHECEKARQNILEDPRNGRRYSIYVKKSPSFTTGIVETRESWRGDELRHEAQFMNHIGRRIEACELLMQLFKQESAWFSEDRELLLSVVKQFLKESSAKIEELEMVDNPELGERLEKEQEKISTNMNDLIEALESVIKSFVLTVSSEHSSPGSWHHTEYLWFHKFMFILATFTHDMDPSSQNMKRCDTRAQKMESLVLKEHPCSPIRLNWAYDYANWLVEFDRERAIKVAKLMKLEAQSNIDTTSNYEEMAAASEWLKKIKNWLKNIDYLVEVTSPTSRINTNSESGGSSLQEFPVFPKIDLMDNIESINFDIDNV